MKKLIEDFFTGGLAPNETATNLKQYLLQIRGDALCSIFKRFQKMTGMHFLPEATNAFCYDPHTYETQRPFHDTDLLDIGERVKHMGCTEVSEGFILLCKADDRTQRHQAKRYACWCN